MLGPLRARSAEPAKRPSPNLIPVSLALNAGIYNVLFGLRAGAEERVAGPGDVVTVAAGTPHRFWNAGETEARFLCEIRPALEFESLIETMFRLAADGKTNRKGMPNPLRLAVIAKAHFDTVRLPTPPAFLQQAGLLVGAALGRLLGYRPTYPRATGEPALSAA